jgi:hypothetical protein
VSAGRLPAAQQGPLSPAGPRSPLLAACPLLPLPVLLHLLLLLLQIHASCRGCCCMPAAQRHRDLLMPWLQCSNTAAAGCSAAAESAAAAASWCGGGCCAGRQPDRSARWSRADGKGPSTGCWQAHCNTRSFNSLYAAALATNCSQNRHTSHDLLSKNCLVRV